MPTPQYYPRAQFSGTLKWSCVFCGGINADQIRPGTISLKCGKCKRHFWYGVVMHIPLNAATQMPRDHIIPSWAGEDEYPFDTIPQKVIDLMKPAFMDVGKRVKQRGRVHVIMLHEGIYLASPEPAADDEQTEPTE